MNSHTNEHDRYASAGVNYEVLDRVKRLAQTEARSTAESLRVAGVFEVPASRGETAHVIDVGDSYLATVMECLGTKSGIADAMRPHLGRSSYDKIARDTVAAILNDLAAVGATPMVVNAYFSVGTASWFADEERASDLIRGWAAACREAGAVWGGGETPSLDTIVMPTAIDLAGSALGVIRPKSRLVTSERIEEGDAIVIIASTGVHANGISMMRQLSRQLPEGYLTPLSDGRTFGDALLDPSPLYSTLVTRVLDAGVDVHYLVHVTGHGWRKLMRADRDLAYVIDTTPAVPPVLAFAQQAAGLSDEEAYGTFNMGAGFAFYVAPGDTATVVAAADALGLRASVAGRVEQGPRRVVLQDKNVEFSGESLQIR
jgi:phosphoribosylformylglycinamidine cyclo-ligase